MGGMRDFPMRPSSRRILWAACGWILLGALSRGLAAEPAPTPLSNPVCPVLTGQEASPSVFVDYQGRRIYFCCRDCVGMFLKNPSAYLANLPPVGAQAAIPAPSGASAAPAGAPLASAPKEPAESGWLTSLGDFHPAVVHFPIALILVAILAEILALFSGAALFKEAARFNVLAGAAGALVAVLLGFSAEEDYRGTGSLAGIPLVEIHQWFGMASMALIALAAVLSEWGRRRTPPGFVRAYRAALFAAGAAVAAAGYFGGVLVYGL